MELFYVTTTNGRIFYTSISLNDRFKQYNVFSSIRYGQDFHDYEVNSPTGYRQDYRGHRVLRPAGCRQTYRDYFKQKAPKWPREEIYQGQKIFEKAPVIWDSNFHDHSSIWTIFRESPWGSFDKREPEIFSPVENRKKKRNRRKRAKKAARKILTKEKLDDELDEYMINIK